MNEPEQKYDAADSASIQELRNEVQSLNSTLSFVLVLMFIFSVCVNIFLFRQASEKNMEATNAEMMVNNFNSTFEEQARQFWFKLTAYASTHPDFAPVYNKWSGIITIHSNNVPAAVAPKK